MIKDILVYLDGGPEDATRLAYAENIANRQGAHLTGLYCNIIPEMLVAGNAAMTSAQIIVEMQESAVKSGDDVEEKLKAQLDQLSVPNELRRIDVFASQAGNQVAATARRADLFVASRLYGDHIDNPELFETVLFNSGRGCLFVPPGKKPGGDMNTVLVGWRNTRETARALAEALPLLKQAKNVIVALVLDSAPPEREGEMPGADIARHLDRHGVNVELREITGWDNAAAALLNEANKSGADLVVMGGYGHSRFREWVLGGVTRDVMNAAEVPVLLAH